MADELSDLPEDVSGAVSALRDDQKFYWWIADLLVRESRKAQELTKAVQGNALTAANIAEDRATLYAENTQLREQIALLRRSLEMLSKDLER